MWKTTTTRCADQGLTEPGSTFKLASMMALLDDNPKITLSTTRWNTGNGSNATWAAP